MFVCTVPRPSLTCCACECECGLGPYQSPSIRILCTVCVCDGTPTQPTSPHLPARKLCGRVLRLCCPNPRHATSAAVALVRPAPLLAITYLLTRQTLPRQLNLLTAVIVDRKSHCVPHPPLCRSRECLHPVNKMCTYSNTKLSAALFRARRPVDIVWDGMGNTDVTAPSRAIGVSKLVRLPGRSTQLLACT